MSCEDEMCLLTTLHMSCSTAYKYLPSKSTHNCHLPISNMAGYSQSPLVHYIAVIWFILLTAFPAGLLASQLQVAAGNSSFSTSQSSSFWSLKGGYTFGFQAFNGGSNYLLSIWHSKDTNNTAIWWPFFSNDLGYDPRVKAGATFNFSSNGSLELRSPNGALLWSTNTTSSYAILKDTGHLVLYQNKSTISWQSFADSRDSLMLADLNSSLVPSKPYLLQSRRNKASYTVGRFRLESDAAMNVYLHGLDALGNDFLYQLKGHINVTDAAFSLVMDYGQNSTPSHKKSRKLSLDPDGNLRIYRWNKKYWHPHLHVVVDKCMLGSPCGPFGICEKDVDKKLNCNCPTGYHARMAGNNALGCDSDLSNITFNASCGLLPDKTQYTTKMVELPGRDYTYNDLYNQSGVDKEGCKNLCLKRCADCIAASYYEDQRTCFLKGRIGTGYLMNGMDYTDNNSTLLFKVVSVKKDREWVIPLVIASVLAIIGCSAWLLYWKNRKRPQHTDKAAGDVGPVRFYGYGELMAATRNFSEELGKGGFGTVFKGYVRLQNRAFGSVSFEGDMASNENEDLAVAVKVLNSSKHRNAHSESYSQFKSEMNTLGKIHHVNLVSLLGYSCSTTGALHGKERMLVYEYMQNGSLDKYLSSSQLKLAWGTRYSIALGIARGIAYLHHECSPPILHCDIKPHNVLLDAHFIAKVADFGLAKRFRSHHAQGYITMPAGVRGMLGYIAPELFTSKEATFKVDVYSFGKVLLELVRGFRARSETHMSLDEWATKCILQGAVMEFPAHQLDEEVATGARDDVPMIPSHENNNQIMQQEENEKLRLLKVGMWCIQHKPSMRPLMSRVVQLIEGTITIMDPPMPPVPLDSPNTYILSSSSSSSSSCNYLHDSIISAR